MNSEKPMFGKFKIIDCLKKDEGLAVYIADHIFLDKRIIVKTLNTKIIADSVILKRFKREAKLLARISHPNIITVYDFGMFEDFFYISFEYFKSKNLREAFKENAWSNEEKINIIQQILAGLEETHRLNIIHRDLKPENILINKEGLVKIADFGLALVSGSENLTAQESVVGTPAYMSPEQVQGLKIDIRSDLFSLGIIIFELYYKANPFLGKDTGQTLNNIIRCNLPEIETTRIVPEYIIRVIDGLLKKKPAERLASVSEILGFFPGYTKKESSNHKQKSSNRYLKYLIPLLIIALFLVFQNIYFNPEYQKPEPEIFSPDTAMIDSTISNEEVAGAPEITQPENLQKKITPLIKDTIRSVLPENVTPAFGYVDIFCSPWADIYVDSLKIDTTPLKNPIKILSGGHKLKLIHPDYPQYMDIIYVPANDTLLINVNLDTLAAYLHCNVYPWGNIYLNNQFKGQTPLNSPIILSPGNYQLEIRNPKLKPYAEIIKVQRAETLFVVINLDSLNNP